MPSLSRMLQPRTIAVVGGGAWCKEVIRRAKDFGFRGDVFAVHPKAQEVAGIRAYSSLKQLP
ncbi:MAG: CoA-binding protein, partial [Rhodobacterales bacterium]|nr:CoA-binding protein [Rhodobacterales bacterium]